MPTRLVTDLPFRGRRVALVRLRRPDEDPWAIDAAFDGLEEWLASAGRSVVFRVWQRRRAPAPATYLGRGKALQLRALCDLGGVETVVLDGTPTPAQRTNLEGLLDRPVADRSVWAPPGQPAPIVSKTRALHRQGRRGRGASNVVLVGCAGAGKSTLLAAITRATQPSSPWPAAPGGGRQVVMTRRLRGASEGRSVLVTDTPGLVWNPEGGSWTVPPETRAEWREADLLLHVIDASHPEARRRANQVARVLAADHAPDSRRVVPVWTQADRVADRGGVDQARWIVSGRTGSGCEELIAHLWINAGCHRAPREGAAVADTVG
jgi:50S ribosomal subunit-associated GTPase HflX